MNPPRYEFTKTKAHVACDAEATVAAGKPTPEANCEFEVEPQGGAVFSFGIPQREIVATLLFARFSRCKNHHLSNDPCYRKSLQYHHLSKMLAKISPLISSNLKTDPVTAAGPDGRAIAILVAKRDLQPGEMLSRHEGLAPDEVLLEHGWCSTRRGQRWKVY